MEQKYSKLPCERYTTNCERYKYDIRQRKDSDTGEKGYKGE